MTSLSRPSSSGIRMLGSTNILIMSSGTSLTGASASCLDISVFRIAPKPAFISEPTLSPSLVYHSFEATGSTLFVDSYFTTSVLRPMTSIVSAPNFLSTTVTGFSPSSGDIVTYEMIGLSSLICSTKKRLTALGVSQIFSGASTIF